MSKGRILKMALDEIVGGVKKVDLGDLTKKVNVGDRVEAVKRMLGDAGEKVAEKADDWGWKGGKEGELTGQKYIEIMEKMGEESMRMGRSYQKAQEAYDAAVYQALPSLSRAVKSGKLPEIYNPVAPEINLSSVRPATAVDEYMRNFAILERANVPREWTGRVFKALTPRGRILWPEAVRVSNAMKTLTNDQREEFLSLLPEWTESLDDLANAVRML